MIFDSEKAKIQTAIISKITKGNGRIHQPMFFRIKIKIYM